jgi:hypothetical protein
MARRRVLASPAARATQPGELDGALREDARAPRRASPPPACGRGRLYLSFGVLVGWGRNGLAAACVG